MMRIVKFSLMCATFLSGLMSEAKAFSCDGKADGKYSDPVSCTRYYVCAGKSVGHLTCFGGITFNPVVGYCDHSGSCDLNLSTTTTTESAAVTNPLSDDFVFCKIVSQTKPSSLAEQRDFNSCVKVNQEELMVKANVSTNLCCQYWSMQTGGFCYAFSEMQRVCVIYK